MTQLQTNLDAFFVIVNHMANEEFEADFYSSRPRSQMSDLMLRQLMRNHMTNEES